MTHDHRDDHPPPAASVTQNPPAPEEILWLATGGVAPAETSSVGPEMVVAVCTVRENVRGFTDFSRFSLLPVENPGYGIVFCRLSDADDE